MLESICVRRRTMGWVWNVSGMEAGDEYLLFQTNNLLLQKLC